MWTFASFKQIFDSGPCLSIKVFLSINAKLKEQNVIDDLGDMIGYYYAQPFFYEKDSTNNNKMNELLKSFRDISIRLDRIEQALLNE